MTDSNAIKRECEVKQEPDIRECSLCLQKTIEFMEMTSCVTLSSSMSMADFIYRITNVNIDSHLEGEINMCLMCNDLINQLDNTIVELSKLQKTFLEIINKNPLFLNCQLSFSFEESPSVSEVKNEEESLLVPKDTIHIDSDDEPLVVKKKRGRKPKEKKVSKKAISNDAGLKYDCVKCSEVFFDEIIHAEHVNICNGDEIKPKEERLVEISLKIERESDLDSDHDWQSLSEKSEKQCKRGRKKSKTAKPPKKKAERVDPKLIKDIPNAEVKTVKRNNKLVDVYSCKECPSVFTYANRLIRHMEKHEQSKPPYICDICGAKYKHKKACDIHVAMHKGISDWRCDECDKIFPSKNALQRHNAIHTGKPIYQCDLCGKSFIHTSSFKMHKLSHTGLKPHKCDICGLALMTRSHLKRHKRIHSGEKRHECSVCGKRFSERYNLIAHQRSHSELNREPKPEKTIRNKMFRCTLCELRFERRYMLERHLEVVHQRILERGPPKPRNTMTKLLKAKALAAAKGDINIDIVEGNSNGKTTPVALITKVKTDTDQSPVQPNDAGPINFETPNASWQVVPSYSMLY